MNLYRQISTRLLTVWYRNWVVYRQTWKIGFLPPLLEPLLYLVAFGVGLSSLVGELSYQGQTISYIAFIAPALIAANIMNTAFFENTYASFVRMYYQKTFDAMLATPLFLPEIVLGEILWGATRAVIGTILMTAVITAFGLLHYPHTLLILPVALLGGLAFGAVGLYCTAIMPNIENFNLAVFLFITPMFLFSGTFFPLASLPGWGRVLAQTLPLTHLVALARGLAFGELSEAMLWSCLYLVVFAAVFTHLALRRMQRRLVR